MNIADRVAEETVGVADGVDEETVDVADGTSGENIGVVTSGTTDVSVFLKRSLI